MRKMHVFAGVLLFIFFSVLSTSCSKSSKAGTSAGVNDTSITTINSDGQVASAALTNDSSECLKGMIVYAGTAGDGNGSFIYAISPDGKVKKMLTTGVRSDDYPAVSPDGMAVIFSSAGDDYKYRLYAIDGSGRNLRLVAEVPYDAILASWSPDGKRIAFLERGPDNTQGTNIYIVNPDGSGLNKIVSNAQHNSDYQYPPVWSNDGKKILYDRVDLESDNENLPECLYTVNTDGSGEVPIGNHNQTQTNGAWSPDNRKVVYYGEKREFNYNRQDNSGIFVMNSDGTGETFLAAGYRPVWSPDGSLIVYTEGIGNELIVINSDGTNKGAITEEKSGWSDPEPLQISFANSAGVKSPVWSPDGKKIVFVTAAWEESDSKLIVAEVDGKSQLVLSTNVRDRTMPDWK